jgi:uracil-DNA glycosylase
MERLMKKRYTKEESMEYWKPYLRKYLDYKEIKYLMNTILPKLGGYEPSKQNVFKVFETHPEDIKVIILGKSPYCNAKMATGLAYQNGWEQLNERIGKHIDKSEIVPVELSIVNNEVANDYPDYQGINHWQEQGVFLLNVALTSERGNDEAHLSYWHKFTISIIKHIAAVNSNKVWLLWGTGPKTFTPYINNSFLVKGYSNETIEDVPIFKGKNYILPANTPMMEYWNKGFGGFYGKNHFKFTNKILQKSGVSQIKW